MEIGTRLTGQIKAVNKPHHHPKMLRATIEVDLSLAPLRAW
jgi:hypothetical protein